MKFEKKDLRTLDVVTYRNGKERTVYLGTPNGDILKTPCGWKYLSINRFLCDLTAGDDLDDEYTIIKVQRKKDKGIKGDYETIYERKEKLPYNAWYKRTDIKSGFMMFYTKEDKAFGIDGYGRWCSISNGWLKLNSGRLEPVPTEEWQARLIEHAKERGYKNGNYECLTGDNTLSILGNPTFCIEDDGDVWIYGVDSGNKVFDAPTGKWAEIIEKENKLCDIPTEELFYEIKRRIEL